MQKQNYSINPPTKLLTIGEARERYRLSRSMLERIARNADAWIKIGRCVRVDMDRVDQELELHKG